MNFKSFLQRKDARFRTVPTNAHWHNKSKKSVDLFKSELSRVSLDHPDVSVSSALRLAFIASKSRLMPTYKLSRKSIRLCRRPSKIPKFAPDFVFSASPLSPALKEVDKFLDAADKARTSKLQKESRVRIEKAMKQTSFPNNGDVDLRNGDCFTL